VNGRLAKNKKQNKNENEGNKQTKTRGQEQELKRRCVLTVCKRSKHNLGLFSSSLVKDKNTTWACSLHP